MFTEEDRRKELNVLLHEMRTHPSRDWEATRERTWVLARMLRDAGAAQPRG